MTNKRLRADALVHRRGLAESRAKAQAMILAGDVRSNGEPILKAGTMLFEDAALEVRERPRFVSRGGDKLDGALADFGGPPITGLRCLDVGASTGGFTDCLLSRGAREVVAVDVGYGQLASKLRSDARVMVLERTNARHLTVDKIQGHVDLTVVDASFIGIGALMPAIALLTREGGALVALVKPQFEAGKRDVTRGRGVIRDEQVRDDAIDSARRSIVESGFRIESEVDSRTIGPKGNVERFVWATRTGALSSSDDATL